MATRRSNIFAVGASKTARPHIRGALTELDNMTISRAKSRIVRLKLLLGSVSVTETNKADITQKIALLDEHVKSGRLTTGLSAEQIYARRLVMSKNENLLDIFSIFWYLMTPYTNDNTDNPVLDRKGYIHLYIYMQRALMESHLYTAKELQQHARDAYDVDVRVFGPLTQLAFFDYLYDTIDTWTELLDPSYYSTFAWSLLDAIADTRLYPPCFRRVREVVCCTRIENEAKMVQTYSDSSKVRASISITTAALQRTPAVIKRLMARKKAAMISDDDANAIRVMYDLMVRQGKVKGIGKDGVRKSDVLDEYGGVLSGSDDDKDDAGSVDDSFGNEAGSEGYSDDEDCGKGGKKSRRKTGGRYTAQLPGLVKNAAVEALDSRLTRTTILAALRQRDKVILPEFVRQEERKAQFLSKKLTHSDGWRFDIPADQLARFIEIKALRGSVSEGGLDPSSKQGIAALRLMKAMVEWASGFYGETWQQSEGFAKSVARLEAMICGNLGMLMPDLKKEVRAEIFRCRVEEDKLAEGMRARKYNNHISKSLRLTYSKSSPLKQGPLDYVHEEGSTSAIRYLDLDDEFYMRHDESGQAIRSNESVLQKQKIAAKLAPGLNATATDDEGGRMARVGHIDDAYFAHLENIMARRQRREKKKAKLRNESDWANHDAALAWHGQEAWVEGVKQREAQLEAAKAAEAAVGVKVNQSVLRQVLNDALIDMSLGRGLSTSREGSREGSRRESWGDGRGGSPSRSREQSREGGTRSRSPSRDMDGSRNRPPSPGALARPPPRQPQRQPQQQ